MTDFPTLQARLRASQQPRAELPPIPDLEPLPDPHARSRRVLWSVAGIVFAGLTLGTCAAVHGAEREQGYEIWAVRAGGQYLREDRPNWLRIQLEPYPSKADCQVAIAGIQIDRHIGGESGWRLTCRRSETMVLR